MPYMNEQIQRDLADQKSTCVLNLPRYSNGMLKRLTKTIDQQQATIKSLEQQIKKYNFLLYGNEESEINIDAKTIYDLARDPVEKTENIENNGAGQLRCPSQVVLDDAKWNCGHDSKKNDKLRATTDEEILRESNNNDTKKMEEDKHTKYDAMKGEKERPIEKATSPNRKIETVQISPTYFSADQLSKLNSEFNRVTENYKVTNIFPNIEVVPNTSPVDDHPVMKKLCEGVVYRRLPNSGIYYLHAIKIDTINDILILLLIGTSGFERDRVRDLLAEYPELTLYDVVRAGLKSTNEWREIFKMYDFFKPAALPYPD